MEVTDRKKKLLTKWEGLKGMGEKPAYSEKEISILPPALKEKTPELPKCGALKGRGERPAKAKPFPNQASLKLHVEASLHEKGNHRRLMTAERRKRNEGVTLQHDQTAAIGSDVHR